MNKQTEALKLALSVLDEVRSETFRLLRNGQKLYAEEKVWNAIFVIKQALAEQPAQQEPVAWVCHGVNDQHDVDFYENEINALPVGTMLYPSPPASKPWVGLTEKEKRDARNSVSYSPLAMTMGEWTEAVQDATEAKLREKNHG